MPRFLTIAPLLLVAACGQQKDRTAASNEAAAAPAEQVAKPAVPALEGEWQVATLRGRPIEGPALVARFGQGKVRVAAGCNRRAWTFTQNRNIVSFAADPSGSVNCESSPTVAQESAFGAIDRATMAIFSNGGREASLSGDGGTITLARR